VSINHHFALPLPTVTTEINSLFPANKKVRAIENLLKEKNNGLISLRGLAGSALSFIAASTLDALKGNHLFILPEKEEAAYFLNDLENLIGKNQALFFPSSYKKPYDPELVENSNILFRSEALNYLSKPKESMVIITYPQALFEKVVTQQHLKNNTFEIHKGEKLSIDFLVQFLHEYDFERVDFVMQPGEFSIRGGIIDVFSFSNDYPFRIELFDDEVESLRTFDITNQLSIAPFQFIQIIPNINERLLIESRESFLDSLPENTILWTFNEDGCAEQIHHYFTLAEEAYQSKKDSLIKPLSPSELFVNRNEWENKIGSFRKIEFNAQKNNLNGPVVQFEFQPQPSFNKNFELFIERLKENIKAGYKNILFADTQKQAERIFSIIEDITSRQGKKFSQEEVFTVLFPLHEGFIDTENKIAFYTDHQLFNRYHRFKLKDQHLKKSEALTLKELQSLQQGDFIAHIDHGIGRFDGLEKIVVNEKVQESIRLIYKDNDILYVSIHSLHRISKYSGQEGSVPKLNKLGTNTWNTLKERTKKKVKEIAFDLIQLYAKRKVTKGFEFSQDSYLQTELEASFIYEDTPDQITSTAAVKKDMEAPWPMDRLVCGDVGFGKTEVAIRASFKAVCDSKQVAVLVPTTILALQHYKTFSERLKDFPCNIDYINRFKTAKEQKETIEKLKEGKIDIIIGTHRLIGKDIKFKDLGLMVIDEEQKFGVAAKEKLKTIRTNVDTLTLTATPIPRTLQFSMMGARDLSVITTPPPNRFPVQTEVHVFNEELIRDSISYEISRGGQVFFVHNKVQNIKEVSGMIQRLCPDAKVAVGHGQMEGEVLEKILVDFINGIYDVLVATTIIESGLDIANANTILINQAHLFGLSDLHQMRGRVGRSNKKAFCYLLAPPLSTLTTEARKRLKAIEEFSGLGSGFNIAMRDLDIRGAGNLLGGEQSGFIAEIGFEMYMKILNEAIEELKTSDFKDVYQHQANLSRSNAFKGVHGFNWVQDCQIDTDLEILLPDDYVYQIAERLNLYRELDESETEEQLIAFEKNLTDRFGPVPVPAKDLINAIRLRWKAIEVGFEKILLKNGKMVGYFPSKADAPFYESDNFGKIIDLVKHQPSQYRLKETSQKKLTLIMDGVRTIDQAIAQTHLILSKLKQETNSISIES
jgi:transcription-repair coupling factor (superfamily II helicase)